MKRRTFIKGLGAAVTLAPGISLRPARAEGVSNPHLTKVNPKFLISEKEARDWHAAKDSQGRPTMSGSPSWKNFLNITEKGLREVGVVDSALLRRAGGHLHFSACRNCTTCRRSISTAKPAPSSIAAAGARAIRFEDFVSRITKVAHF